MYWVARLVNHCWVFTVSYWFMRQSLRTQSQMIHLGKRGFTLLELLVVLGILGILLLQAVPAMSRQLTNLTLQATARELRATIIYARLYSQRTASSVLLCPPSSNHPLCAPIIHALPLSLQVTVRNEAGEVLRVLPLRDGISLHNRLGKLWQSEPLVWDSIGLGTRNATLSVCSRRYQDLNWSLVINRIGRPRLVSDWGECSV